MAAGDPSYIPSLMREHLGRIAAHARTPAAPPTPLVERFGYGVAQPFLGLRTLWATPHLRRRALGPVLIVLALAAFVALSEEGFTPARLLWRYYATIVGLASLPAVVFANTYARLAAEAAAHFGFGERAPVLSTIYQRLRQAVRSSLLVGLGLAPLLVVMELVPLGRHPFALAVSAAWTLHWIVVEALDAARIVDPTDGVAPPAPWFVAWTSASAWDQAPRVVRGPVRWFGRVVTRLAQPWADEVALVAREPALALGFGLATAALLAVPVANLLLRPAILIGAVHLRARLRSDIRP